jgi:hypothetical protein
MIPRLASDEISKLCTGKHGKHHRMYVSWLYLPLLDFFAHFCGIYNTGVVDHSSMNAVFMETITRHRILGGEENAPQISM